MKKTLVTLGTLLALAIGAQSSMAACCSSCCGCNDCCCLPYPVVAPCACPAAPCCPQMSALVRQNHAAKGLSLPCSSMLPDSKTLHVRLHLVVALVQQLHVKQTWILVTRLIPDK